MLKAYILACLAVASSIPLKLHSISHLSTISKSVPSFHFTKAMLLHCVYWQMHTHAIFFVFKKIQKIANPSMHLHNPLQASMLFCSFHSVTPLPHIALPNHSFKGNQICLRSLLPFRCIPFRAVATCIRSRSLHSIASSFHQPPQLEKQECYAPLPHST